MFYGSTPLYQPRNQGPSSTARDANARARETEATLEYTQAHLERTMMICEALWTFLKEKHGYTDQDLVERVEEIDLRDGVLDGRVSASEPTPCPNCGRNTSRKKMLCLYCSTPIEPDLFGR